MDNRKIVYDPKFYAKEGNQKEMQEKFRKALDEAPKPDKHPNQTVVVKPSIEFTGRKITIKSKADLDNLLKELSSSDEEQENKTQKKSCS